MYIYIYVYILWKPYCENQHIQKYGQPTAIKARITVTEQSRAEDIYCIIFVLHHNQSALQLKTYYVCVEYSFGPVREAESHQTSNDDKKH